MNTRVNYKSLIYSNIFGEHELEVLLDRASYDKISIEETLRQAWQGNPLNPTDRLLPELTIPGHHLLKAPKKRPVTLGTFIALQSGAVYLILNDDIRYKVMPYGDMYLRREKSPTPSGTWNKFMAWAYGGGSLMNFAHFEEQRDKKGEMVGLCTLYGQAEGPFHVMIEPQDWQKLLAFFDAFLPDPRKVEIA